MNSSAKSSAAWPRQQQGLYGAPLRQQPRQQQMMADDPPPQGGGDPPAAGGGDPPDPAKPKSLLELGDDPPPSAGGDPPRAGDPPPAAAPYHPEGMADDLKGKTDKETIDALSKRVTGLRDALARKGGAAPEKAEDYDFGDIAKTYGDPGDEKNPLNQPVFKILREAAQKNGIGKEAMAGLVGDVLSGMKAGNMLEMVDPMAAATVSGEKELGVMAKQYGGRAQAQKVLKDERTYLQNLQDRKIIDADDHAELLVAMGTAAGLRAFQKVRAYFTGHQLPQLDDASAVSESVAAIKARWADPRFQNDPAFRAQAEKDLRAAMAGSGG